MPLFVWAIIAIVGVVLLILLLRNYRKQAEWREPPGKVPEDY